MRKGDYLSAGRQLAVGSVRQNRQVVVGFGVVGVEGEDVGGVARRGGTRATLAGDGL